MGIRAERKLKREQTELSKQTALPGGKALLPCWFVYGFCSDCEQNRSGVFDDKGDIDTNVGVCKKGCRKPIYNAKSPLMKGSPLVASTFPVLSIPADKTVLKIQRRNAGGCDVREDCDKLVLMLMDADIARMYDF